MEHRLALKRSSSLGIGPDLESMLGPDGLEQDYKSRPSPSPCRRPSLPALLGIDAESSKLRKLFEEKINDQENFKVFGLWDGVFLRNAVNSFGSFVFLKLGMIFGIGGIFVGSLALIIAALVTLISALSFGAIVSNGEATQGGGVYLILSRTLGPKFGVTVGLLIALAGAMGAGISALTFADALILQIGDSEVLDSRIIAVLVLLVVMVFVVIGLGFTVRLQSLLFLMAIASIISICVGCFLKDAASSENLKENFSLKLQIGFDFSTTLALAIPGFSISAGAVLLTRVKNPHRDIPYGTIYSACFIPVVFLITGWIVGSSADRNELVSNTALMGNLSASSIMFYIGIYVCTISSAIIALSSAPRVLQAVAKDDIIPNMYIFSKENAYFKIPINSLIFCTAISVGIAMIGNINWIAPYVTVVQLLSYAVSSR
jgi:amino acid transporter